jgi:hypothetical protein
MQRHLYESEFIVQPEGLTAVGAKAHATKRAVGHRYGGGAGREAAAQDALQKSERARPDGGARQE